MSYKIAVITENRELAHFFELEMLYRGFVVDVFSSKAEIDGSYILAITDMDTCHAPKITDCFSVAVSSSFRTAIAADNCALAWPTPISDIDKLCRIVIFGDRGSVLSQRASSAENNVLFLTDEKNFTVSLDGKSVRLSKSEFSILKALCDFSGETVKREHIMEILGATNGNISDVYIYHLRKKLEGGGRRLIFTDRGVGYRTVLRLKR